MKKFKAAERDNIKTEQLIKTTQKIRSQLNTRLEYYISKNEFPSVFKHSQMMLLYKSGNQNDVKTFKPIRQLPNLMKIFTDLIHEERSTTEQIICLRMIIENHVEYNKPLVLIHVDFLKAFDLLHTDVIWQELRDLQVEEKIVNNLKNLHENLEIFVKTTIGEEFVISSEADVKQDPVAKLNGEMLEKVETYEYLGQIISIMLKDHNINELKERIKKAYKEYFANRRLFQENKLLRYILKCSGLQYKDKDGKPISLKNDKKKLIFDINQNIANFTIALKSKFVGHWLKRNKDDYESWSMEYPIYSLLNWKKVRKRERGKPATKYLDLFHVIWQELRDLQVEEKIVNNLKNLHENLEIFVKTTIGEEFVISSEADVKQDPVAKLNGEMLEKVETYEYLGQIISIMLKDHNINELKERIKKAYKEYFANRRLFQDRNIDIK
uniref:Reverse transcriptase domain-containing protein n=1 Tax=Strongyloides venezuelensis TaxID=75913 RepID=A0A0K0FQC1_STRVS